MERATLGRVIEALTSLARTGWMLRGVPSYMAESVASHSFAAALIAAEIAAEAANEGIRVDPHRAMVYAIVHDLGESVIGDISRGSVEAVAKGESERRALESLATSLYSARVALDMRENEIEWAVARIAELVATAFMGVVYARRGFHRAMEVSASSVDEAVRLSEERGLRKALSRVLEQLGLSYPLEPSRAPS